MQEGINKRKENKKEKFELAVIDYIKDLSTNINISQEVEKLLKEIMKGVEECFNLVRKEVRKEKDTIHILFKIMLLYYKVTSVCLTYTTYIMFKKINQCSSINCV